MAAAILNLSFKGKDGSEQTCSLQDDNLKDFIAGLATKGRLASCLAFYQGQSVQLKDIQQRNSTTATPAAANRFFRIEVQGAACSLETLQKWLEEATQPVGQGSQLHANDEEAKLSYKKQVLSLLFGHPNPDTLPADSSSLAREAVVKLADVLSKRKEKTVQSLSSQAKQQERKRAVRRHNSLSSSKPIRQEVTIQAPVQSLDAPQAVDGHMMNLAAQQTGGKESPVCQSQQAEAVQSASTQPTVAAGQASSRPDCGTKRTFNDSQLSASAPDWQGCSPAKLQRLASRMHHTAGPWIRLQTASTASPAPAGPFLLQDHTSQSRPVQPNVKPLALPESSVTAPGCGQIELPQQPVLQETAVDVSVEDSLCAALTGSFAQFLGVFSGSDETCMASAAIETATTQPSATHVTAAAAEIDTATQHRQPTTLHSLPSQATTPPLLDPFEQFQQRLAAGLVAPLTFTNHGSQPAPKSRMRRQAKQQQHADGLNWNLLCTDVDSQQKAALSKPAIITEHNSEDWHQLPHANSEDGQPTVQVSYTHGELANQEGTLALLSYLGGGSFCQVYGVKTEGGELAALKIWRSAREVAEDTDPKENKLDLPMAQFHLDESFLSEVTALSPLCEHAKEGEQHIVKMLSAGKAVVPAVRNMGRAGAKVNFMLLELLAGTLEDRLKAGPMSEQEALKLLRQMLKGLIAMKKAHCTVNGKQDTAVIHRDLKPGNMMFSSDGVLKICDFGFAKVVASHHALNTTQVCTRLYASPEVLKIVLHQMGSYTAATDVWSLGCLLYEMVMGKPPFLDMALAKDPTKALADIEKKVASDDTIRAYINKEATQMSGDFLDYLVRCLLRANPDIREKPEQLLKGIEDILPTCHGSVYKH